MPSTSAGPTAQTRSDVFPLECDRSPDPLSFVPSFKDQIDGQGDTAFLYFECHDVVLDSDDPTDPPDAIVTHLYDAGTIRNVKSTWLFQEMHGGTAPLSVSQIYYP